MNQRIILHIGFWLVYLLLPAYVIADLGNASYKDLSWAIRLGKAIYQEVWPIPLKAGVFYLLFYYLVPNYSQSGKFISILKIIGLVILSLLAHRLIVGYVIYPVVYEKAYEGELFSLSRFIFSFIDIYSVIGIAGAIKLMRGRQRQKEREQQLIREKLESELHFLRAQINPHFFFNTLNNIYGLARKRSEDTAEVVMRLSKLMRFILYECSGSQIQVTDEIKVIEDYIALEKLRYNERLKVSFTKEIDHGDYHIAPLLLLPFVENSFKHGASELRSDICIDIALKIVGGALEFQISNNYEDLHKEGKMGLGLKNVQRQLELTYPQRHHLAIKQEQHIFHVHLKINLHES